MNNQFVVEASPEILNRLRINVLYIDGNSHPLGTYYDKGVVHTYQGAANGYVLYVNYDDALFFRAHCDLNPEYFDYSTQKTVALERLDDNLYVNVVFLKRQEARGRRYDAATQMLPLEAALVRYQDDFHPVAWREQVSLEDKFKLLRSP